MDGQVSGYEGEGLVCREQVPGYGGGANVEGVGPGAWRRWGWSLWLGEAGLWVQRGWGECEWVGPGV